MASERTFSGTGVGRGDVGTAGAVKRFIDHVQ